MRLRTRLRRLPTAGLYRAVDGGGALDGVPLQAGALILVSGTSAEGMGGLHRIGRTDRVVWRMRELASALRGRLPRWCSSGHTRVLYMGPACPVCEAFEAAAERAAEED